jgi:hypothetical protein
MRSKLPSLELFRERTYIYIAERVRVRVRFRLVWKKTTVTYALHALSDQKPSLNVLWILADFLQGLLKNKDRILVQTFNSNFHYIYDVLSFWTFSILWLLHLINPNDWLIDYFWCFTPFSAIFQLYHDDQF